MSGQTTEQTPRSHHAATPRESRRPGWSPSIRSLNLLEAYFTPAIPLAGGSKTGAQISNLTLFSVKPCPACDKQRKLEQEWGRKRDEWDARQTSVEFASFTPFPDRGGECQRCRDTGFIEGRSRHVDIDRWPTGSSKHGRMPHTPASRAESAEASVVMRRVVRHSPRHGAALHAYHGDPGEFAEQHCGSRLLPVVTLTTTYQRHMSELHRPSAKSPKPQAAPEPPKFTRRFEGPTEQAQRLVRDDEARWRDWFENRRIPIERPRAPKENRRLRATKEAGEPARTFSAGEQLLADLVGWMSDADPERQALWHRAELEAESLLRAATQTWEVCCGRD